MLHFSTVDRSIARTQGMTDEAVLATLDQGGRVVVFEFVFTLALSYYKGSHRYFVRPGESLFVAGAPPTLVTLIGGWWGIALLNTPTALFKNLRGGIDVTDEARAELVAKIAGKAEKARLEQAREASAKASDAPPEARRLRAIELLARRDTEGAWALVGEAVVHDRPPGDDEDLLRRLALALRDRRAWGRAAESADALRRHHPAAESGYVATALRDIDKNATRPDGYREPTPAWQKILFVLMVIVGIAVMIAVAWDDAGRHH